MNELDFIKEPRSVVLYARIRKSIKQAVMKLAKRKEISEAIIVDALLEIALKQCEKKTPTPKICDVELEIPPEINEYFNQAESKAEA